MSKLFELYVLGLLKDKYGDKMLFQAKGKYGRPDYLLTDEIQLLIIDAKYRLTYRQDGFLSYIIDNIRQISGYARDVGILDKLPDSLTDSTSITGFTKFYKVTISVPVLKNQTAE